MSSYKLCVTEKKTYTYIQTNWNSLSSNGFCCYYPSINYLALNTDQVNNCAQRKAGDVAEDLRKLILQIFASFLSSDGRKVDYKGIRESPMFDTYKSMARELQRVDIKEFSR